MWNEKKRGKDEREDESGVPNHRNLNADRSPVSAAATKNRRKRPFSAGSGTVGNLGAAK